MSNRVTQPLSNYCSLAAEQPSPTGREFYLECALYDMLLHCGVSAALVALRISSVGCSKVPRQHFCACKALAMFGCLDFRAGGGDTSRQQCKGAYYECSNLVVDHAGATVEVACRFSLVTCLPREEQEEAIAISIFFRMLSYPRSDRNIIRSLSISTRCQSETCSSLRMPSLPTGAAFATLTLVPAPPNRSRIVTQVRPRPLPRPPPPLVRRRLPPVCQPVLSKLTWHTLAHYNRGTGSPLGCDNPSSFILLLHRRRLLLVINARATTQLTTVFFSPSAFLPPYNDARRAALPIQV
jgi:hypothetical protein